MIKYIGLAFMLVAMCFVARLFYKVILNFTDFFEHEDGYFDKDDEFFE